MRKPPPLRNPTNMNAILAVCEAAGADGVTTAQLRESTAHLNWCTAKKALDRLIASGRVFGVGPDKHRRWFSDQEKAQAFALIVDDVVAAKRAEQAERAKGHRAAYEARRQAKRVRVERKPKPAVVKPAKNAATPWRQENQETKSARAAQLAEKNRAVEIITPEHVKVQVVPGYMGDPRYTVNGPVIGGFRTAGVGRYLDGRA